MVTNMKLCKNKQNTTICIEKICKQLLVLISQAKQHKYHKDKCYQEDRHHWEDRHRTTNIEISVDYIHITLGFQILAIVSLKHIL